MEESHDKITNLVEKLGILLRRQESFSNEINQLRNEINLLKSSDTQQGEKGREADITESSKKEAPAVATTQSRPDLQHKTSKIQAPKIAKKPLINLDLEKFIGENLTNKIGITITVIGVAIGAKYAIDHQLISPATRIILGYLVGIGLAFFAYRLKKKYKNLSSVLLSGSMAIMYFITYAAYIYFSLIPQLFSFVLMLLFTAFTVFAAINYNRQIIAHFGLVGAYAVPFLLGEESSNYTILFSYIAIINIGILAISFKKYWKSLYYFAFLTTWLIFSLWYAALDQPSDQFGVSLTFLCIFFLTFYLNFLAYKLLRNEKFESEDILLLLANSFIFYGIGYSLFVQTEGLHNYLGLFTLCNSIIHLGVSIVVHLRKLADRNLLYLISGLVIAFITISFPVQMDGNWVTLLWALECVILFWIGRTKNIIFYEKLAYSLFILAFLSIIHDWSTLYNVYDPVHPETRITPIFNQIFLTSLIVVISFVYINFLNQDKKYISPLDNAKGLLRVISFIIPSIMILTLYFSFSTEIATYWNQKYTDSIISGRNDALLNFKFIWLFNYTLFFLSCLAFINIIFLKNQLLAWINLGLNLVVTASFLTTGLYLLSELRENYLSHPTQTASISITLRYISYFFFTLMTVASYKYVHWKLIKYNLKKAFDLMFHTALLWIISSELIHWLDIAEATNSYKLGLSILWGVYAFFLIALGIWKQKKHLRLGAIILFTATLIKLFFYDLTQLETIPKTIVFVSLGILLLLISYLYNRYRHIISDENEN